MIGETAWEQRVRLGHERQARGEADRLAILATRPSPIPEEKPMTERAPPDPDAPATNDMPIEEWMAHETARQAKREKTRLAARVSRDGDIGVSGLVRGSRGALRY